MTRSTPIPETMTLHVPFRVVKRGGRKEMRMPVGVALPRRTENTLVKALARAFRWKRLWSPASSSPSRNWPSAKGLRPPT